MHFASQSLKQFRIIVSVNILCRKNEAIERELRAKSGQFRTLQSQTEQVFKFVCFEVHAMTGRFRLCMGLKRFVVFFAVHAKRAQVRRPNTELAGKSEKCECG